MIPIHEYLERINSREPDPYPFPDTLAYPARYPTGNTLSDEEIRERHKERFAQITDPRRYIQNLEEIRRLEESLEEMLVPQDTPMMTVEADNDEVVLYDADGNVVDREPIEDVEITHTFDPDAEEIPMHPDCRMEFGTHDHGGEEAIIDDFEHRKEGEWDYDDESGEGSYSLEGEASFSGRVDDGKIEPETTDWECDECGTINRKRILSGSEERRCPSCLQTNMVE